MKCVSVLLVVSLGLLLVGVAPAQDSLNCRLVGYCPTPGRAQGVAVAVDIAMVMKVAIIHFKSVDDGRRSLDRRTCASGQSCKRKKRHY